MKLFKCFTIALAMGMPMVGCSDDDDLEYDPNTPVIDEGALDLLNGYTSIIFNADSIKDIQLFTQRPVKLNYQKNEYFDFKTVRVNNKQVLRSIAKKDLSDLRIPLSYKITLTINDMHESGDVNPKLLQKSFYLTFRKAAYRSNEDKNLEYARVLGRGTHLEKDFGNTTHPILDFDMCQINHIKGENLNLKSVFYEFSGSRYHECMQKIGTSLGLSGLVPIPRKDKQPVVLSGGLDFKLAGEKCYTSDMECYISYYGKRMSEVKLNLDDYSEVGILSVLDKTANNVLNNPSTNAYKKYKNTKEDIFNLFDEYGTHIITRATFGGNYSLIYARETNAYSWKIGTEVGVSLSGKIPCVNKGEDQEMKWVDVYRNMTCSPNVKGNLGFEYDESELDAATKAFYRITAKGGNASKDMLSWDQSLTYESRNSWVPITFSTEDSDSAYLIPIFDPEVTVDSTRRVSMAKFYNDYIESKAKPMSDSSDVVVVDFLMKATSTEDNGHVNGQPHPFVGTDPSGKKRVYFPMMANLNAPEAGYPFETSSGNYIHGRDKRDQYWYYALGHYDPKRKNDAALIDVKFSHDEETNLQREGYIKRGDDANRGVKLGLKDNYVYIKYADSETKSENIIRAIGLLRKKDSKILTSTGGSEMSLPFTKDDSTFIHYWTGYKKSELKKDEDEDDRSVWYEGAGSSENDFYPVYSHKRLPVDFFQGEENNAFDVTHPLPWPKKK